MDEQTVVIVDPYSSGRMLAPALREAGMSVVAVTTTPPPDRRFTDSFKPNDFDAVYEQPSEFETLLSAVAAHRPVAVLMGTDSGVELADRLAAVLTPARANVAALSSARRHKGLMLAALEANGIPTMRATCVRGEEELAAWLRANRLTETDLVLKPPRSSGTDGVTLCRAGEDWREKLRALIGAPTNMGAADDEVVVQERLHGIEYIVDTFSVDGRHSVTNVCRYSKLSDGQRFAVYESIDFLPYDAEENPELIAYTARVLDAVGIRFGPAHTEIMLTEDGPRLIETAPRMAGSGFPWATELATGESAIGRLVADLSGTRATPVGYELNRHVVIAYFVADISGTARNTAAYQAIGDLESCRYLRVKVKDGDQVTASSDLKSTLDLGLAILCHPDRRTVDADHAALRRLEREVTYEQDARPSIAPVHHSVSTWQQPAPPPASAQRDTVIARLADRIAGMSAGRLRVGIDGFTASGKTSFGHELAERISRLGRPVLRASLDDFKKPWRDRHLYDRESGEGYYRNAFDYHAAAAMLLEPAGPDGTGRCALCCIDPLTQIDHSTTLTTAEADAVLIVDGVFAFRPEINGYWDFRIWLDVEPETAVRRGMVRDRNWAGSDAEDVHRNRYVPAHFLYLSEVGPKRFVDVVMDNSDFSEPRLLLE
jgi:biotin carboxylase/uridine kinase